MRKFLQNQFDNVFLWTPFIMAAGTALYFTMPTEPNYIITAIIGLVVVVCALTFPRNLILRSLAFFVFGFCYSAIYTAILNTPQIAHPMRNITVVGDVSNIDYTPDKARIYLRVKSDDIRASGRNVATVRVSVMDMPVPKIGDKISTTINLFPPNTPYAPASFDYARWSYFNGLTATGYVTDYNVIERGAGGSISALRDALHRRGNSFLADSLVLGYKNAVPRDDGEIWTATGIGHVWSISGFHMTLVGGWLFAFFFAVFRLIAPITRRVPARVAALCAAWVGLLFYLFLSGIDVATVRAFLMTTLIFMAFIFGRRALSMRNICIAFCLIFLINPHYVMQAGFQLSFAAIFGLIWLWNVISPKMPANKILKIICTAALTSIVAMIFTMPFVIAHFGAVPIYSLIGNLVLLPIFSFAIMPLVIIGTITTALFGWNAPLNLAESVYDFTFIFANKIADMPAASLTMPHTPNSAICFFVFGLCCLMFIKSVRGRMNYILCGTFVAIGVAVVVMMPKPIFYATYDHELVGFVKDGDITFNKSRAANHFFAFDTWKQMNGTATDTPNRRQKHKSGVYEFNTPNFNLVYIQKFVPLHKNILRLCNDDNVDYIVSYFKIDSDACRHKILKGAFIIYPSGRVKTIPAARPWHRNLRA